MENQITCVFQLSVKNGMLNNFKELVDKVVAATRKEAGTLAYFYSVDQTGQVVHIIEQYEDSPALISHIDHTFAPFADEFIAMVEIGHLTVYGSPDQDAQLRLNSFGAMYLVPFAGFIG